MQSVTIIFDDNEEFDSIISAVGHIFSEDPSVIVVAAGPEKTDELMQLFPDDVAEEDSDPMNGWAGQSYQNVMGYSDKEMSIIREHGGRAED